MPSTSYPAQSQKFVDMGKIYYNNWGLCCILSYFFTESIFLLYVTLLFPISLIFSVNSDIFCVFSRPFASVYKLVAILRVLENKQNGLLVTAGFSLLKFDGLEVDNSISYLVFYVSCFSNEKCKNYVKILTFLFFNYQIMELFISCKMITIFLKLSIILFLNILLCFTILFYNFFHRLIFKEILRKSFHLSTLILYTLVIRTHKKFFMVKLLSILCNYLILLPYLIGHRNPVNQLTQCFKRSISDSYLNPLILILGIFAPYLYTEGDNSGLIIVGVADVVASIFGVLFGKTFWPNLSLTIEGTCSQLVVFLLFCSKCSVSETISFFILPFFELLLPEMDDNIFSPMIKILLGKLIENKLNRLCYFATCLKKTTMIFCLKVYYFNNYSCTYWRFWSRQIKFTFSIYSTRIY